MGIFDEIVKGVGSQILGGSQQGGLMEHVFGLINNPDTGGIGGLIQRFGNKGLGDAMSSWISTGENQPVSGEQVTDIFGNETIQQIAQKLGISGEDASSGLAALLPQIIDRLTPDGTVPKEDLLAQGLNALKQKLLG